MGVRASTLGCAIAALGLTAGAQAAVIFTYQAPQTTNREFGYRQPGGAGQTGSLVFDESVVLDFTIDATAEGGPRFTVPAILTFAPTGQNNSFVGPAFGGSGSYLAIAGIQFEFRAVNPATGGPGQNVLLAGSFTQGFLTTEFGGAGSVLAAQNAGGGDLVLSAGPALFAAFSAEGFELNPAGFTTGGPSQASWSLTDFSRTIGDDDLISFGDRGDGTPSDRYLPTFDARSSFVASATVVPTPGAVALLTTLAGLGASRRRRVA